MAFSCEMLFETFKSNGLDFFTGVPDSTFKEWMSFLADEHGKRLANIIACNECEATAIASGYHLSTGKIGVVYMQNAGEGKAINPLASLCDPEVYSIPLFLIIGWRGEPGKKDEPQHKKMGRIMMPLLDIMEIPYSILPQDIESAKKVIAEMKSIAEKENRPVAVIIKSGTLEEYSRKIKPNTKYELSREEAIKSIINNLEGKEIIISTTGKTSRELFEYRTAKGEIPHDFYTVGSMGCSASIALGIALQKPEKKVIILDGDGAAIMQMGALATIGHYKPKNFLHVIFDNNAHDSTGGQPTVSDSVEFNKIAIACGYRLAKIVHTRENIEKAIKDMEISEGPSLLVIKVNPGARKDLGRPTTTPLENKDTFMKYASS